ncbi:hypothetical protein BSS2_I1454 [Brucella suis bv. 1 str. S2]|nr:hypothetical protein BR1496 [Brucella suis 1330]AHN47109.1 hypothetical protein BSS2_I1454 [Brucella suis bv. 1 str. S2]EFG38402.1 conserved hypothetical protein [Brucella sp. NVSL 07-0026]EFM56866.1 Hypothetical protein BIBO1_1174 [Brucella inopinata BO1]AEM18823.1 hypothetical protein BS1330_I1490 [Brucella suis 1330]
MTKGPQGPFFIFIIQEWTTGQKPKKKPDKRPAFEF